MRISDALVQQLVESTGKVSKDQIQTLKNQQKTEKKPLQDLAVKNNLISSTPRKSTCHTSN
jgi:hypothetical protein